MKKLFFFVIFLLLLTSCVEWISNSDTSGENEDWVPKGCMPHIGTMLNTSNIMSDSAYNEAFSDVFNKGFVSGNPKMWQLLPDNPPNNENRPPESEADFNFATMDGVITAFKNRGYDYDIFHNIIVHQDDKLPYWYTTELTTYEQRREALEMHVRTVSRHFKGQIPIFIVVNHPFVKPPLGQFEDNYMRTGWSRTETLTNVYKWADEENPDALLIINEGGDTDIDGGVATNPEKTQAYVNKIKELTDNGVPIEGIGIMGHFGLGSGKLPPDDILRQVFSILESSGLPVYVTEFDISYDWMKNPVDPELPFADNSTIYDSYWDYQAYAMKHFIQIADEFESVKAIYLWGMFADPSWREGTGIYFDDYTPKASYYEIRKMVALSREYSCE